jgi:hypothetical protein
MYGKEPDCFACMPIELRPENVIPFQIYQQVRGQLIMAGMDGTPIDVSIPAVKIVMDFHGVGDNRIVFEKVLTAARAEIHEANERRKLERQSKG